MIFLHEYKLTSCLLGLAILAFTSAASSAPVYYDNEAAYLDAIAALNKEVQAESFENNAVWSPRSTPIVTAPLTSVTSKGITWSSNADGLPITTFDTVSHSGQYHLTQAWNVADPAFWSTQSANPDCLLPGNCGDGFAGSSTAVLYGVGGWILAATSGSRIGVFLDGSPVSALGRDVPLLDWTFIGVIDDAGFNSFEFREMEYVWQAPAGEGWRQIRSDSFKFAVDNAAVVPVPAALPLFVTGLLAFAGLARRKVPGTVYQRAVTSQDYP